MITVAEYLKNGSLIFNTDNLVAKEKLNATFNVKYGCYYMVNPTQSVITDSVNTILEYNKDKYDNMVKAITKLRGVDPLNQSNKTITTTNTSESKDTNVISSESSSTNTNTGTINTDNTTTITEDGVTDIVGNTINTSTNNSTTTNTVDNTNTSEVLVEGSDNKETGKRAYNSASQVTPIDTNTSKSNNKTTNTSTNKDTTSSVVEGETTDNVNNTNKITDTNSVDNKLKGLTETTNSSTSSSTNTNTVNNTNESSSNGNTVETFYYDLSKAITDYLGVAGLNILEEVCKDVFNIICIPIADLDDLFYY